MVEITKIKITPREREVYNALTSEPLGSAEIAERAVISSAHPKETAAKFCISLTKKGLAVKHGSRMFPKWSRAGT